MSLINYRLARRVPLPPYEGGFFEYVLAANGLFARSSRAGMEVTALVQPFAKEVRGLALLQAALKWNYPPVSAELLLLMLKLSRQSCDGNGRPTEILFYLVWQDATWMLVVPEQEREYSFCRPIEGASDISYERAIIEVHSHHTMPAYFSPTDDRDEQGFRLYGVLGDIFEQPQLRLRAGVFGYFLPVPIGTVFEECTPIEDALVTDDVLPHNSANSSKQVERQNRFNGQKAQK